MQCASNKRLASARDWERLAYTMQEDFDFLVRYKIDRSKTEFLVNQHASQHDSSNVTVVDQLLETLQDDFLL